MQRTLGISGSAAIPVHAINRDNPGEALLISQSMRKSVLWIVLNAIGIVMYLYAASNTWAPHGEEALLGGPGDPIIWSLSAFPILLVASILNLAWMVLILLRSRQSRNWHALAVWVAVVMLWAGVFAYDHSRQYTGSGVVPNAGLQSMSRK